MISLLIFASAILLLVLDAGAYMGACYASTLSAEGCGPMVSNLSNSLGSTLTLIQALTLPVHSWFSGHAFNLALKMTFGDTQIEDLWIRYFCVTTDITAGSAKLHTAGPLWRYCRASMSECLKNVACRKAIFYINIAVACCDLII